MGQQAAQRGPVECVRAEAPEEMGEDSPWRRMRDNSVGCFHRDCAHVRHPFPHPATLPTDKELVLKVIPMPADTNGNGDIFGGWVMAQVDLAGSVLARAPRAGTHGHRGGE